MKLLDIISKINLVNVHNQEYSINKRNFKDEKLCWSLNCSSSVYSKIVNDFVYESSPSNRTEDDYKETRFDTPLEALEAFSEWIKKDHKGTHPKLIEGLRSSFKESDIKSALETL